LSVALLEVRDLYKHFPVHGGIFNRIVGRVHAVNGVSFDVEEGEIVGVIGESGCGKSTLAKTIIRLQEPTAGTIRFEGTDISHLSHSEMIPFRRRMQIIFQDPYSSLNPRMTTAKMLREVIRLHKVVPENEIDGYIDSLIAKVGLPPDARDKYPHEFSGGQRQRIGIARALALNPEFLIADEPVSALDVSVQAQVLNLLHDLKHDFSLTILFIAHDLKVVAHFCDRMLVMYLGHVVEELPCDDIHAQAQHPYTKALLGANPINDPDERKELTVLEGEVPSPYDPPPGCPFVTRCPLVMDRCHQEMPPLVRYGDRHDVACWAVEIPEEANVP
jgi:oligopeptide/dipeptide ABC transporter ATP-binding protein